MAIGSRQFICVTEDYVFVQQSSFSSSSSEVSDKCEHKDENEENWSALLFQTGTEGMQIRDYPAGRRQYPTVQPQYPTPFSKKATG